MHTDLVLRPGALVSSRRRTPCESPRIPNPARAVSCGPQAAHLKEGFTIRIRFRIDKLIWQCMDNWRCTRAESHQLALSFRGERC